MRSRALLALALALALPAAATAQTVRIPFPQEDGSLTPYTFRNGYALMSLVYDTLMLRDVRGVPRPWLAERVERDGLDVTITLRDGARWHDGRAVTADDVAFTFRFVAQRPHPRFTPQVRDIASVRATGPRTIRMRLRRPSLGLLDQPFADVPILPRHLWQGLPEDRAAPPGLPVGSGPYRLARHDAGDAYAFEAVDGYPLGRPAVKRLEVPIIRRVDRSAQAMRAGRLDAMLGGNQAVALEGPGIATARGPSYTGTILMFNLRSDPFRRLAARRAVADAVDLERVSAAVAGLAGAVGVPPADRGYVSPESTWASERPLHRPDIDRARLAFAEQGIQSFTVLAQDNDPVAVEAARQVVLAVERAGGRARLEERAPAALADAIGQDGGRGGFQAAIWSTSSLPSYDPAFLRASFGDPGPISLNHGRYASRAFDAAARRVDAAPDVASRRAAVQRELEVLAREVPVLPLFYAPDVWAYRISAYDGWAFVRGGGILDKRSLLAHPRTRPGTPAAAARDPLDRTAGDASPLPYVLGAIGLLALAAGAALFRTRPRR